VPSDALNPPAQGVGVGVRVAVRLGVGVNVRVREGVGDGTGTHDLIVTLYTLMRLLLGDWLCLYGFKVSWLAITGWLPKDFPIPPAC
jgi:hypothetical protein